MAYAVQVIFLLGLLFHSVAAIAQGSDEYIAGYSAALLEQEFHLPGTEIQVDKGAVTVYVKQLGGLDPSKISAAVVKIPGVTRVDVREGVPERQRPIPSVQAVTPEPESKFLPRGLLFDPLHADPRWPHFGAAYHWLSGGRRQFASSFGESFAFYRDAAPFHGQWEFGMQAGVFGIFDTGCTATAMIACHSLHTLNGVFYPCTHHVHIRSGRSGPWRCDRHRNKIPFPPQRDKSSWDEHKIFLSRSHQALCVVPFLFTEKVIGIRIS